MILSVRRTAAFFVLSLFVVLPFLAVLRYKLPIYSVGDSTLSGSVKDVLVVVFAAFAIVALAVRKVRLDWFSLTLAFFVLWMAIRSVCTLVPVSTAMNAFRLEALYPVFFLLFYLLAISYRVDVDELHKRASAIVTAQFVIVVAVAYVEQFDRSIRYIFYGAKADNLVTGFPGVAEIRLVSLLENPINLGLFICVALLFVFSHVQSRRRALLPVFVAAALPVVALTFSRMAAAVFAVVAVALMTRAWFSSGYLFKALCLLLAVTAVVVISNVLATAAGVADALETRIEQGVSMGSVEADPRLRNWSLAAKTVDQASPIFSMLGGGMGLSDPAGKGGAVKVENSFVTMWIQLGVLGVGCFSLLLFQGLVPLGSSRLETSDSRRALVFVCRLFVLILVIAGLTADVHRNSPFSFYLWYFVTAAALLRAKASNGEGRCRAKISAELASARGGITK